MSQTFDNDSHMRRRQSLLLQNRNFDPSSPEDDQYANQQATLPLHSDTQFFTPNLTSQTPHSRIETPFLTPNQTFASQAKPIASHSKPETPFLKQNQTLSTSTPHINEVNYPSLNHELQKTKSTLNIQGMENTPWKISQSHNNRVTLSTRINGVKYNYLPKTRRVHDIHGNIVQTALPSNSLIDAFLKTYATIPNITIEEARKDKQDERLEYDIRLMKFFILCHRRKNKYIYLDSKYICFWKNAPSMKFRITAVKTR